MPSCFFSTHFSRISLSSHWTVELAPWQLYLLASIDRQGQLVKLATTQNPWVHKEMMRSSLMELLTIILMCGQDMDMLSTLLLHLLDSGQGTHKNNSCIQCDLTQTFMAQVLNLIFCSFVCSFYFSHVDRSSSSNHDTTSANDMIRGTEVAPPPSSSLKQTANSPSWLTNITSSTFRNKQPKAMDMFNGGNNLVTKFKYVTKTPEFFPFLFCYVFFFFFSFFS